LKNQDGSEADAAPGSDPSDTRSQDEILEELFAQTDGPVVVQLIGREPYLFEEQIARIWNAPHVISVICPSIVHWIDASEEGSLCMIGQYEPDLDPAAISEGRWYETDIECCVNRAEYDRLLADPEADFTGIGDTVPYTEPKIVFRAGSLQKAPPDPISKELTVVGIVEEEGIYADSSYGKHHVYTTVPAVEAMLANYTSKNTEYFSKQDRTAYAPFVVARADPSRVVYKEDPKREGKALFRCAEEKIYTEEEWTARFQDLLCNAGYTVEVTLDSGKNYIVFSEYWRLSQFRGESERDFMESMLQSQKSLYEEYERLWEMTQKSAEEHDATVSEESKKRLDEWLREALKSASFDEMTSYLIEIGELDDWYTCNSSNPVTLHPLRVEE